MTFAILYAVGFAHGLLLALILTRRPDVAGGYSLPKTDQTTTPMPKVKPPRAPVGGTGKA